MAMRRCDGEWMGLFVSHQKVTDNYSKRSARDSLDNFSFHVRPYWEQALVFYMQDNPLHDF